MKKKNIIESIVIFIISVLSHFTYDIIKMPILSIFFPVNESIFEHMKLIITPVLIYTLGKYLYYKYKNMNTDNMFLASVISSILGIIGYLIVYLPVDNIIGYNTFFAIGLLFITFIFIVNIDKILIKRLNIKHNNLLALIIIVITYIIFTYLTYRPPHNYLFLDITNNSYGIKKDKF